ncbi:hypothetical protein [Streptomyces indicus]|uniref:Uncharacterized protein n=1 Tax=Streptomyces indicus TaxID=417292 RepID=A0A1G8YQH4_9ACTN|nr:hypothetical protein [Streptomyces indicus]SDK05033.1 hypothetical protein SAMN05421806_104207 [Streptomyces indicus]
MGRWAVISQYHYNEKDRIDFIRQGLETKDEALEELRAALPTYLPASGLLEQWRRVYRLPDQETYLVVIKGMVTKWTCTLRIAELVADSTDPSVAESAQRDEGARIEDGAAGPQDRIPPGF